VKTIGIIIPVWNEEENILPLVKRLEDVLPCSQYIFELLFIDDGSTDGTWHAIEKIQSSLFMARGIRLSRNFGKESALMAGVNECEADALITIDGDFQHPPSVILEFLQAWDEEGYPIVEAVKSSRGTESGTYKGLSLTFYWLFSRWSGLDLKGSSDFKLLDRQVILELRRLGERNLIFRGLTSWLGFQRKVIQFEVQPRLHGEKNMSLAQRVNLAKSSLTSFTVFPLRMLIRLAFVFLTLAVLVGAHAIYVKVSGRAVEGFTTVIILQLVIGGFLLLGLGIIGEYIAQIYDEVKARPRYIISKRVSSIEAPGYGGGEG